MCNTADFNVLGLINPDAEQCITLFGNGAYFSPTYPECFFVIGDTYELWNRYVGMGETKGGDTCIGRQILVGGKFGDQSGELKMTQQAPANRRSVFYMHGVRRIFFSGHQRKGCRAFLFL